MTKRLNFSKPYFDETVKLWRIVIELPPGPNGKRRRKRVAASTKEAVRTKARAILLQLDDGLDPSDDLRTVEQFLDWWQSEVLPGTVSEGTIETYERVLRLWVTPHVGRIRLTDLTPAHVTKMLRELEKQGLSVNSRSLARRTLARALRRAEQESWVVRNAARLADGPRSFEDEEEQRSLTPEEAHLLLQSIRDDRLAGPITLQLALGLRRGEVLGLTWPLVDVKSEHPEIKIRKQIQRRKGAGLVLCPVKTKKSRRTLALPRPLVEIINAERKQAKRDQWKVGEVWNNEHDLVFTTPLGTPIDPDNYRHRVSELAKEAGIGHIGTHTLRHSMGSFLYALGVPTKTISELMGHSSTRVTEDVYLHVQKQAGRDAAAVMEGVLWG